eukprot:TRINITY_DN121499_c0_g1_i1.p1 TRINITY_DN121499_c0_g1~~TRINITY_DN121499_c0_g1_i1.p1  ORF type:complete len:505 (+),score=145.14 TRINITY_DN121499_c0_g1_i1:132-1517(+)
MASGRPPVAPGMPRTDSGTTFLTAPDVVGSVPPVAPLAKSAGTLVKAGEIALKAGDASVRASSAQERRKVTASFVRKHCQSHVSEEWTKVDDGKIAKLRGILAALQEENQETQLLKKESENAEARRELEATRSGVEARLHHCKEREEQFERNQAALRRKVMENEKILQELETNIEKGEKKSKDEQGECRKLEQEIAALDAELAELEVMKAMEQKKISQTSQYKRFLEAVVHECEDDFEGDIENLMSRHVTLEAGNKELHQTNAELSKRLDAKREEANRVRSRLQSEHLVIGSQLHECQVSLDKHRGESREMEQRLNRAQREKELKESQVGVIQMAIEQLFTRTVTSCRLKQRKKAMLDAVENRLAPVRGDKSDYRLEEMLRQIIERIQDLKEMHEKATDALRHEHQDQQKDVVQEVDMMDRIKFVTVKDDRKERGPYDTESEPTTTSSQLRRERSTEGSPR